jgi:hypothetical protein
MDTSPEVGCMAHLEINLSCSRLENTPMFSSVVTLECTKIAHQNGTDKVVAYNCDYNVCIDCTWVKR